MNEPAAPPTGWNDRAAVALLVLVAGHLRATEPPPLTPARLAQVTTAHSLPQLAALLGASPDPHVRDAARHLGRLLRAGTAGVYARILPGLPVALGDPVFRLTLARAAARAGFGLFPPPPPP